MTEFSSDQSTFQGIGNDGARSLNPEERYLRGGECLSADDEHTSIFPGLEFGNPGNEEHVSAADFERAIGFSVPDNSDAPIGIDTLERYNRPLTEQEMNQEDHDIFPDYEIREERLGRGGCAVVYEGWRKSDNFHVAVKVLAMPATIETDEVHIARRRFYREAKLISSLNEKHIVQCVDYGVYDGQPCMVLEFIEGQELGEYLKPLTHLSIEEAICVTIQVLEALEAAHEKTIIHRDIKPGNIMVLDEHVAEHKLQVKVLDFGIATVLESVDNSNTLMTQQGNVRGTPSYMAPELFTGAARASVESDLYAVGLVLLECLTNTIAFDGASFMQIAYKQCSEPLDIPGYIPPCLAELIQKACAKKIVDRFHSAREFITALQDVQEQAVREYPKCYAMYEKSGGKMRSKGKKYSLLTHNGGKLNKSRIAIIVGMILLIVALLVAILVITLGHQTTKMEKQLYRALRDSTHTQTIKSWEDAIDEIVVPAEIAEAERIRAEITNAEIEKEKQKAKELQEALDKSKNAEKKVEAAPPTKTPPKNKNKKNHNNKNNGNNANNRTDSSLQYLPSDLLY